MQPDSLYWMTIAHPLIRIPVFLMGIFGGLQVLRAHPNQDTFRDPNLHKNFFYILLPWNCSNPCRGRKLCFCKNMMDNKYISIPKFTIRCQQNIWRRRVDFSAFIYVTLLLVLTFTQMTLDVRSHQGRICLIH